MLVTPAFAQASPFGGDSLWVQLLPFVLIFVIMYFPDPAAAAEAGEGHIRN